jgi:proteasome-associated ATPase
MSEENKPSAPDNELVLGDIDLSDVYANKQGYRFNLTPEMRRELEKMIGKIERGELTGFSLDPSKLQRALDTMRTGYTPKPNYGPPQPAPVVDQKIREEVATLHTLLHQAQATILTYEETLETILADPKIEGVVLAEYDSAQYSNVKAGDKIMMLDGDYKGCVGRVYTSPNEAHRVRINLEDGVSFLAICPDAPKNQVKVNYEGIECMEEFVEKCDTPFRHYPTATVIDEADERFGQTGQIHEVSYSAMRFVLQFDDSSRRLYNFMGYHKPIFRKIGDPINMVMVATADGRKVIVNAPPAMDLYIGVHVLLNSKTLQIIDTVEEPLTLGPICNVRWVSEDTMSANVELNGSILSVVVSSNYISTIKEGDRVVLDSSSSIVINNLGSENNPYQFCSSTNVSWDDVGGLEEAKATMREAIELPHLNKELYEFYGKKPIKGILLYGPPGCGKTMLAKAAATSMQRIHAGEGTETGFIYVKGPEILERFVGVAEATIRSIFSTAREHKAKHGYPAVVFIDEADAILSRRGTGISTDMEKTIVPMFLAEMDGLDDNPALFILATNRADVLDPAVIRDGRIDRKIEVTRPDEEGATSIFELNFASCPRNDVTIKTLAEHAAKVLFETPLRKIKRDDGFCTPFCLGHVCNGAMISGVVDRAKTIAMNRDIENGTMNGLTTKDVDQAILATLEENKNMDYSYDFARFIEPFKESILEVSEGE